MPPLVWRPASPIPSYPSTSRCVISDMCFSADARYLAIACGTGVQFWDLSNNNAPLYLGSSKAPEKALCVTSFRKTSAFVSGHEDGALCVTRVNHTYQEPIRTKLVEAFHCEAAISFSLFDDCLLAVITPSNVRLYAVSVLHLAPVRLVGTVPLPMITLKDPLNMNPMPRTVHWLTSQQLAVSYANAIFIWGVEVSGKDPARFKLIDKIPITGSVADITADGLALIRVPKNFKLLSLSTKHDSETIVRRSRFMAGLGPGTNAKFVDNAIFEGSTGKAYLWELSGRRLQTFLLRNSRNRVCTKFAYGKETRTGCARVAVAVGPNVSDGIAIWVTHMPQISEIVMLIWISESMKGQHVQTDSQHGLEKFEGVLVVLVAEVQTRIRLTKLNLGHQTRHTMYILDWRIATAGAIAGEMNRQTPRAAVARATARLEKGDNHNSRGADEVAEVDHLPTI
ncbi:hypothetical protein K435DRAFT_793137 [Dendrothele bispora CBS 962.96]|uniref:WD40 repeat-like protein n=1 Tax=Dendrothele bispora (strain CBS 962.96) TaxID=1314807 RepID=A0A4S8MG87_DENBC|nr:hypothetical protein K435DRAFT_793137 [Dendrothele bispora CBS 962.96]